MLARKVVIIILLKLKSSTQTEEMEGLFLQNLNFQHKPSTFRLPRNKDKRTKGLGLLGLGEERRCQAERKGFIGSETEKVLIL